ncbi:PREDICTED: uncharacterized protein LOC106806703 [Priapulus caudatus]|uniref:Mitochondria-eating protein n=1 Tax=Priapulus caudatus TaxID=37621 RepID=A0ABM1DW83_PRICU|nr:PREDICTED: uncharacterized protein LOC106806703 [Priapulus caudatus]
MTSCCHRLSDQARRQLERGSKFENLSLGEQRPTQLIRQYGNLYMQVRVEALDALDNLREMDDSDDLKSKLAFSVVVLSFRSVRSTIEQKKAALRHILGIPSIGSGGSSDPAVTDMLESIGYYMRKSTEKYDIRPNVQDVCSQLYSTLFDFPSLSTCHGLTAYIEECVKLAWALSNQIPAYCIEYDANAYNANFHERFHNSNPYSDHVISYLWPALREGEKGPCVYKAIVIT